MKDRKRRIVPVPAAILADGSVVEMVYDPKEQLTGFAVYKAGQIEYQTKIQVAEDETLIPYSANNSLIKNDVVLFPSQAVHYHSDELLIQEIKSFIHTYVDVSPSFESIAAYYVLFSWIYEDFNELPYLRVIGDPGSGKTRFLQVVGSLCHKPIFASGASTVSPLFRLVDTFRGTLIIDEGDWKYSDETAEIVKMLNVGNTRGFVLLRSEQSERGREFSPRAYNVYGPKVIATRGLFQDRALESRCLTEQMNQRRLRYDIPINLTKDYKRNALEIQNKLLMFRFQNLGKHMVDPSLVDRSIEPRLNQVFVPLMSVIQDQAAREDLKRIAQEYHQQIVSDRGMQLEAQVLEITQEMQKGHQTLFIKQIASRLVDKHGDEYDRKITPHWIGRIMRQLGLKAERMREGYRIPESEHEKLGRLYVKYNLEDIPEPPSRELGELVNSVLGKSEEGEIEFFEKS